MCTCAKLVELTNLLKSKHLTLSYVMHERLCRDINNTIQ